MCRCLIRYGTICVTLRWSMEAGYWITILFSLINVIITLWFSMTPLWIPWLFPTFPGSAKKSASAMNFSDCINPDFCEVIVTSIRRTWRKILDFLVRKFSLVSLFKEKDFNCKRGKLEQCRNKTCPEFSGFYFILFYFFQIWTFLYFFSLLLCYKSKLKSWHVN